MKCPRCGNAVQEGFTTDVTDLDDILVIVRHVPCHICEKCGEVVYTGDVVRSLEEIVNRAKNSMSELSVIEFNNRAA